MSLFRLESLTRADRAERGGERFFTRYGPLRLHDDRRGMERTDMASLGAVGVARVISTGHDLAVEEDDCISLLLPLAGAIRSVSGSRVFSARAGGAVLFSPNRLETRVERGADALFRAAALRIPPGALAAAADRLDDGVGTRLDFADLSLGLDPDRDRGVALLSGYAGALLDELDRPDGLLARAGAPARSERHILEMLAEILAAAGALSEAPAVADASAHRRVRAAKAFMHAHYREIVSVCEVAREVGLSLRALQLAFRAAGEPSPRAALWSIRLEAARDRLTAPDATVSVSAVALDCGFTHLGRFASAYRARFGETPSATLRRALRAA